MYLNRIKELLLQLKVAYSEANVFPCNEHEVQELERAVGLKLPAAYKEFLLWAGHGAGWLMEGSRFYYDDLLAIQETAREMLQENESPDKLPDDAFVFWSHQGYQFSFFRTSQGDDPPVHHYCEGENNEKLIIAKQRSFTRFLEVEIEDHARLRDETQEIRDRMARDWTRG